MDKISIITISFNCKDDIERTIKSVLNLDYPNIEYVIVDGASKDGTIDVINKYKDKIDTVISEPDKGIYDAMNKGIKNATGDWIIFMNAGDTFHSTSCVKDFFQLIDNDTTIAHGDIISVHAKYQYRVPECAIEDMKHRMAVRHQATFTRLSYHKDHLFDISFRSSGDYNFFYNAYFDDHVKFQHIPIIIADFDAYTGTSNVNFRRSFRENRRIWGKERNKAFIMKQEIMFVLWDLSKFIKNIFLSDAKRKEYEILKLKRSGVSEIEVISRN